MDAAHKRLLGRRLRQLLVVVGAVGVLARRDARVLVVLLVRRRRVGGVVLGLGLGAVLLDHGREELLFLAFVLLEERRDLSVWRGVLWLCFRPQDVSLYLLLSVIHLSRNLLF